jgi:hypothetical protein
VKRDERRCECGLDLAHVASEAPDIEIKCLHDGSLGLRLHPDEGYLRVHPGDNLEVKWRLSYPKDGGPPVLREIGVDDGHRGVPQGDDDRAISGDHTGEEPFGAFADEGASPGVTPDGFEPLVGYRAWIMTSDYDLKSTAHDYIWKTEDVALCQNIPGGHHVSVDLFRLKERLGTVTDPVERSVLESRIDQAIMDAKRSPERNCMCGFYAVDDPGTIPARVGEHLDNLVYGRIKAWGKIAEYSEGFRAEKVRIDALFAPSTWWQRRKARRVARKYGVPLEKSPVKFTRRPFNKMPLVFSGFWLGALVVAIAGHSIGDSVIHTATLTFFYMLLYAFVFLAIDYWLHR